MDNIQQQLGFNSQSQDSSGFVLGPFISSRAVTSTQHRCFKGTLVMFNLNSRFILHHWAYVVFLMASNGEIMPLFPAALYYICLYISGCFHRMTYFTWNGAVAFEADRNSSKWSWNDCWTSSFCWQREARERDEGDIEAESWWGGCWSAGWRDSQQFSLHFFHPHFFLPHANMDFPPDKFQKIMSKTYTNLNFK